MPPVWAEGGLWSCVEDLGKWLGFQLGAYQEGDKDSPILAAALRREMHKPRYLADDHWTQAWGRVSRTWWPWNTSARRRYRGMPARDIVDLEVVVATIGDEAAFSAPLRRLGFRRFNPPDLAAAGLRLFVPDDGSGRVHVHVCELGSAQHRRHVTVRDYLRAHPDEARPVSAVRARDG